MSEKKDSLKEKAYRIIKDKIIRCEYLPGDFLNEKALIEEIGASRTPIREALNKIEQENLVRIIPKRGVVVSEITMKDISEIFQVRECVEPYAVRTTIHFLEEDMLRDFKHRFEKLDLKEDYASQVKFYELDNAFHHYIVCASKNKYLIQTMENVYVQNQRIRLIMGKTGFNTLAIRTEHLALIDSLLSRDEEKAVRLTLEHIETSKAIAFQTFMNFTI
ncbi:MAG: GntR family transcriptional regulator [Eubacteriales bacterium]|jgi:DNA-binding GntR family transcriptional regulator